MEVNTMCKFDAVSSIKKKKKKKRSNAVSTFHQIQQ